MRGSARFMFFVAVSAGLLGGGSVRNTALANSNQDKRHLAYTSMDEVDEDFAFQGEYVGATLLPRDNYWTWQYVGLQVVAQGDGVFHAVKYIGGLPGAGWNRDDKLELSGERQGDVLELVSGPFHIRIQFGNAHVSYSNGQSLGQLQKIHRVSPTLGARPPWGADVLFDGTDTEQFTNGRMTEDGLLMEGADFKNSYRDFTLHVEFQLPYMPYARGQGRGNSGVYLQSSYEVQILDSFGLEGSFNECGALYRYQEPDVNMCLPPLSWQTFDIRFQSPRFDDDGNKTQNARITVWHNGVLIHDDFEVERKTGAGAEESPTLRPIRLQNHRDPVRFRNIWLVDHEKESPAPSAPPCPPAFTSVPCATPQVMPHCAVPAQAECCAPGQRGWSHRTRIPRRFRRR